MSEPANDAPSKSLGEWANDWLIETILLALWAGMAFLLINSIIVPRLCVHAWPRLCKTLAGCGDPHDPATAGSPLAIAFMVVALCLLPKMLSLCVALLSRRQQLLRAQRRFIMPALCASSPFERQWKEAIRDCIRGEWESDALRSLDAQTRMMQYAGFFGFSASVALAVCAVVLNHVLLRGINPVAWAPSAIAITVAASVSTSFIINQGRILVRAARRDASARMFAWAARTQMLSVVASVLLVSLLWQGDNALIKSAQGFLMLGITVALFGEQALQVITDRAVTALSLERRTAKARVEMNQIDGLDDNDLDRLSEEGIDTLHALAFASTPQLFFNTSFSLHRICDWQDQALLLIYTGTTKALVFREQLLVRGAMDAQRLAEWFLFQRSRSPAKAIRPALAEPAAAGAPPDAADVAPEPPRREGEALRRQQAQRLHIRDTLVKALGFATKAQARTALHTLAGDEIIHRLRIYYRGSVNETDGRSAPQAARSAVAPAA